MARRKQNETPPHVDLGRSGLLELMADRDRAYDTLRAEFAARGQKFIGVPYTHPLRATVRMGDAAQQILRIRRRIEDDPTSSKVPMFKQKLAELEAMITRLADT